MTKIVAFSGRASSGKSTMCNIVFGMEMQSLGLIDDFNIAEDGKLLVHEPGLPDRAYTLLDVFSFNQQVRDYLDNNVFPYVKVYAFADQLKLLCINLLGLDANKVYGTDADKNTLTHIKWEDMPGIVTTPAYMEIMPMSSVEDKLYYHERGLMTIREVLQYVGTNIFRRIYEPVWVNACINQIKNEESQFGLIGDCRFQSEVEAIQKEGGKVIRLTRNPYAKLHESETELDNYKGFDWVLDNKDLSIDDAGKQLYYKLKEWNYLEYEMQFREDVPS